MGSVYLERIETGHRFVQRQLLRLFRVVAPQAPLDIVKVLMYRPEYFGAPFCRAAHALLRGSTTIAGWTIGERELMGAFISKLNHCVF
jgi:hypothetical protein